MSEIQTLADALAYLSPHPSTKGPVILTPEKMREAVGVVEAEIARLNGEMERRGGRTCPFPEIDIEPETPCPVCGDLGTFTNANMDEPSRCVSRPLPQQPSRAASPALNGRGV